MGNTAIPSLGVHRDRAVADFPHGHCKLTGAAAGLESRRPLRRDLRYSGLASVGYQNRSRDRGRSAALIADSPVPRRLFFHTGYAISSTWRLRGNKALCGRGVVHCQTTPAGHVGWNRGRRGRGRKTRFVKRACSTSRPLLVFIGHVPLRADFYGRKSSLPPYSPSSRLPLVQKPQVWEVGCTGGRDLGPSWHGIRRVALMSRTLD